MRTDANSARQVGARQVGARKVGARKARRGFTLVEVMIVIGIVLALSGLIAFAALGRGKEAKAKLCETDVNNIKSAMRMFQVDFDRYPTDEEGVKVLWDKTAIQDEEEQKKWKGYLEEPLPLDRWGHAWVYQQQSDEDENRYALSSNGPDGQEETDDDIKAFKAVEGEGEGLSPPSGGSSKGTGG